MLSNAYFLAKFRFDTAENEPAKNLQKFPKFANFAAPTPLSSGLRGLARALVHRSSRTQGVGHLRRGDAHLLQANRPINKRSTATLAQTFFDADTTFILH